MPDSAWVSPAFWCGKRVFLTGHTGFKGAWLALWLADMGAHVHGYALAPRHAASLYERLAAHWQLEAQTLADIRDAKQLHAAMQAANPDIVLHLAAQALVPEGYRLPVETFASNVLGTAQVLDCARACPALKAIVVVTSDKCYEPHSNPWGHRENDALGGHDPYSASKAAAELVTDSFRRSFLSNQGIAVATARAGNVIGGGDNTPSRLVPDALLALCQQRPLLLRNPQAIRPWQHVLDSLHGYLQLAQKLYLHGMPWASAWNFAPAPEEALSAAAVVDLLARHWPHPVQWQPQCSPQPTLHENVQLRLDSSKARQHLGWQPVWNIHTALQKTVQWQQIPHALEACRQQINEFLLDARAPLTMSQSANLAIHGEVKRGNSYLEPKVPLTSGGEAPTERSEFFTYPRFTQTPLPLSPTPLPQGGEGLEAVSPNLSLPQGGEGLEVARPNSPLPLVGEGAGERARP